MRKFLFSFLEIIEFIIISVLSVFLIRAYIIQPFLVLGSSMFPNFSSGDFILIDEISLRFKAIERGEVIVFKSPQNRSTYLIKRVIGLPDEKIKISDGKVIIFNKDNPEGIVLKESYIDKSIITESKDNKLNSEGILLGENEYFVLGDNRQYSFDSRDWGILKRENIIGIARLRLWPPKSLSVFAAPNY